MFTRQVQKDILKGIASSYFLAMTLGVPSLRAKRSNPSNHRMKQNPIPGKRVGGILGFFDMQKKAVFYIFIKKE
jgi:hypothetical protein